MDILQSKSDPERNTPVNKLAERDWSPVLMSNQIDEAWRQFKTPFLSILCDLAPMTTVRIKARSEPWRTPDLLEAIKKQGQKINKILPG